MHRTQLLHSHARCTFASFVPETMRSFPSASLLSNSDIKFWQRLASFVKLYDQVLQQRGSGYFDCAPTIKINQT